jgi:tetratricopeptide (TPR) repeat protein
VGASPKETLTAVREALFIQKQPETALAILAPWLQNQDLEAMEKRQMFELAGMAYQKYRQFDEASRAFSEIGDHYQAGYAQMLKGDLQQTGLLWQPLLTIRQNHWAVWLFGMITGSLKALPTYLQLRNHLEADVGHLLWANQPKLLEALLAYSDFLAEVNYEAYKYIGRAFLNAGQYERARDFMLKGQRVLPNDPEVYYHLGEYFCAEGQADQALLVLQQCVQMCPFYTPAKLLRQTLLAQS